MSEISIRPLTISSGGFMHGIDLRQPLAPADLPDVRHGYRGTLAGDRTQ